jgi:branched-subunit amino acid permease
MKLVGTIVGFTEGYLSLDFIVSLVFAILLTRALSELKDRIATKLMLD